MIRLVVVALLVAPAAPASKGGPSMDSHMSGPEPRRQSSSVVSGDILAREPVANTAQIKHILIGWKGTEHGSARRQAHEGRGRGRREGLLAQIKGGADFDALMKQYSEDPGSAQTAKAYTVSPDAQLVIEFKQLGLRLQLGEIGVVESDYGFHIMKRVE